MVPFAAIHPFLYPELSRSSQIPKDWVQARDQGDRTTRLWVEEAHKEQMDWRRNKASKEEGGLRVEEEDVGMALRGLGEEGVDAAATNHNYHRLCQSQVVSMQYLVAQTYLAASILTPCWRGRLRRRESA